MGKKVVVSAGVLKVRIYVNIYHIISLYSNTISNKNKINNNELFTEIISAAILVTQAMYVHLKKIYNYDRKTLSWHILERKNYENNVIPKVTRKMLQNFEYINISVFKIGSCNQSRKLFVKCP